MIAAITLVIPLLFLCASSSPMLLHSQELGRCPQSHETFAIVIHEAGMARLAVSLLGATLIYGCVRRASRWSWVGLLMFFGVYFIPVFALDVLSNAFAQGPRSIFEGLPSSRIAQHNVLALVCALSFLSGLCLSFTKAE
jgi:hypothetical protein